MNVFEDKVKSLFPHAMAMPEFFGEVRRIAERHGFRASNTIGGVATCADELERPLEQYCYEVWGEAFRLGSLAGFPNIGRSDIAAFRRNAPKQEKLGIFYFPHLGIWKDGSVGQAVRGEQLHGTPACGSLATILDEFRTAYNLKQVYALPDRDEDPGQHAVAAALMHEMEEALEARYPLTDLTERCVFAGLARFLSLLESQPNEFILFAGIHLNTPPKHEDYILPVAGILGTGGRIVETGEDAYYSGADLLAMMNNF